MPTDDPAFSGCIQGGAGDNDISVATGPDPDRDVRFVPDDYGLRADDDRGRTEFHGSRTGEIGFGSLTSPVFRGLTPIGRRGGAGEDTITAAGSGMWIDGGAGADVLDLRGLRNAFAWVGDGDVVRGQRHPRRGAGDDTNDCALGDSVTGGPGAGTLQGWPDAEGVMDDGLGTGHVAVRDRFRPRRGSGRDYRPRPRPRPPIGGVGLAEHDGDTLVLKDGRPFLRLGGVTGLTGVIQIPGIDEETRLVDLQGNRQPGLRRHHGFVIRAFRDPRALWL